MNPEEALAFAKVAHKGQLDKSDAPYWYHAAAVQAMVMDEGPDAMVVAALHDVLEDTKVSAEDLRGAGCSFEQIVAVLAITKHDSESYNEYIRRLATNELAVAVKIADLRHNLSPGRMAGCPESLRKRYYRALAYLECGYDVL